MVPKVERVTENVVIGEGPHWDEKTESLYYIDVFGKSILRYIPKTKELFKASTDPYKPTFIVPVQNHDHLFVVTLNDELGLIFWDGVSKNFKIEKILAKTSDGLLFNDGKCDSLGRLWIGTRGTSSTENPLEVAPIGTLYTLDSKQELKPQVSNIFFTNGLAFNDKTKKLYHIDTTTEIVYQFDFDLIDGSVSNRKAHFSFKQHQIPGFPDGMTIDTDGHLWVASFGGGRVLKIDGHNSEVLLQTIELPAIQTTSVAFGGPNLDELYVTTGSISVLYMKNLETPTNGALYRITGTGSRGLPGVAFKL